MSTSSLRVGPRQSPRVVASGLSPEAAALLRRSVRAILQRPQQRAAERWPAALPAPAAAGEGAAAAPHPALAPPASRAAPPAGPSAALPALPTAPSLHALLLALVADGGPGAYRFVMTVLQQEHQAVMAMLNAWGASLRAEAKLEKEAHLRAVRQTRIRLGELRRSLEIARAQLRRMQRARPSSERMSGVSRDSWSSAVRHLGAASRRLEVRPGLAPAPPPPLSGAGGLRLQQPFAGAQPDG